MWGVGCELWGVGCGVGVVGCGVWGVGCGVWGNAKQCNGYGECSYGALAAVCVRDITWMHAGTLSSEVVDAAPCTAGGSATRVEALESGWARKEHTCT